MRILANQHSPVLRRVGVLVNLVRNELADTRVVGKPLADGAADGVPADVDLAGVGIGGRRKDGDDVGSLADTKERVLDKELALLELVGSLGDAGLAVQV